MAKANLMANGSKAVINNVLSVSNQRRKKISVSSNGVCPGACQLMANINNGSFSAINVNNGWQQWHQLISISQLAVALKWRQKASAEKRM
jgi:hypothetical protein